MLLILVQIVRTRISYTLVTTMMSSLLQSWSRLLIVVTRVYEIRVRIICRIIVLGVGSLVGEVLVELVLHSR